MHIHPDISSSLGRQKERDLIAAAERHDLVRSARRSERSAAAKRSRAVDTADEITIRLATELDAAALRRLADLDSARPLEGEALVADVEGRLWAACSLADGATIADPFLPSRSARGLLELRREQLAEARRREAARGPGRLARLRQLRFGD